MFAIVGDAPQVASKSYWTYLHGTLDNLRRIRVPESYYWAGRTLIGAFRRLRRATQLDQIADRPAECPTVDRGNTDVPPGNAECFH